MSRSRSILACVALCCLLGAGVFAAFAPALRAGFLRWDDPANVSENRHVHGLSAENVGWAFTRAHMGHYHPLTWLSYMVEFELWELHAPRYHATNVALHAFNTVLVYFIALRLCVLARLPNVERLRFRDHLAAAFGAAFFGIHPLRAESVAWITERRDVLSALFLMLGTLAHLRSVEPERAAIRSIGWSLIAAILVALSCLSKAWGMVFFLAALLLDIYPLRRIDSNPIAWFSRVGLRLIAQKWLYLAIGVATAAAAAWAQRTGDAAKSLAEWGIGDRVVQSIYGLWFYVQATVAPVGLSPLYELPQPLRPFEPRYLVAYAGTGVAVLILALRAKRWPWLLVAAGMYCVFLAPVLGILQSGDQFVADRYSYLACISLSILLGAAVGGMARMLRERSIGEAVPLVWVGALGLVIWLGVVTNRQAAIWRDTLSMWAQAAHATPTPRVRANYAIELARQGRNAESREQVIASLRDRSTDGVAWALLSELELAAGNTEQAEQALLKAVAHMKPPDVAMVNLGDLYLNRLGRFCDAAAQFAGAIRVMEEGGRTPTTGGVYAALAVSLRKCGDRVGAKAALDKAAQYPDVRELVERERRLHANPLGELNKP